MTWRCLQQARWCLKTISCRQWNRQWNRCGLDNEQEAEWLRKSSHSSFLYLHVCPVKTTHICCCLVKDSLPYWKCHLFSQVHTWLINWMSNRPFVEGHPIYNGCPSNEAMCLQALAPGNYLLNASVTDWSVVSTHAETAHCFTCSKIRSLFAALNSRPGPHEYFGHLGPVDQAAEPNTDT